MQLFVASFLSRSLHASGWRWNCGSSREHSSISAQLSERTEFSICRSGRSCGSYRHDGSPCCGWTSPTPNGGIRWWSELSGSTIDPVLNPESNA
jgi:hypothetical protein